MTASDGNATSTNSVENKQNQQKHQEKDIKKPSQEEIDQHLHELMLATDVKLKQQRQEWFRENNIKIMQYETYFYVVPETVPNPKEMIHHLHYANLYLSHLADQLDWLRKNGTTVQLKKVGDRKKYVFIEQQKSSEHISSANSTQTEDAKNQTQISTLKSNEAHGEKI